MSMVEKEERDDAADEVDEVARRAASGKARIVDPRREFTRINETGARKSVSEWGVHEYSAIIVSKYGKRGQQSFTLENKRLF